MILYLGLQEFNYVQSLKAMVAMLQNDQIKLLGERLSKKQKSSFRGPIDMLRNLTNE